MSLSHDEASLSYQRFPGRNSPSRKHLEAILHAFVDGYNLTVVQPDTKELARELDSSIPPEYLGFAYEGTGLYFALMDLLIPGSKRLDAFTRSEGAPHEHIAMVGAGFAIARVPFARFRLESYQKKLNEYTAFLIADGYGFHDGFFKWKDFVDGRKPAPESLISQNRILYDSGIARAMWWVYGADPDGIAGAISRFSEERRAEMWAGIGVALSYASAGPGVPDPSAHLLELAGPYRYDVLSSIPFSAHMRRTGGNPAPWTDRACSQLLNMTVTEASDMVVSSLQAFLDSWQGPAGERWANGYLVVREDLKQRLKARLSPQARSTVSL